jgi:CRP/FNR family transcriptional regulator, cyclic AMP receptor protein
MLDGMSAARWLAKENMDNNLDILRKTMLFKGSSVEELQGASELFQERLIKSNTTIFAEKMPAEALYIIKSGNVRISVMAGEGEEKALLLLGPGEFFGELALLQEGGRMVTARSETAVELLLITRKDFQALMELDPRTASRLLLTITTLLAMRVKAYNAQLKDMLLA